VQQVANFDPKNREGFEDILTWGTEFETMSSEERDTYEKSLSYVGRIYQSAVNDEDEAMGTCRLILTIFSRTPANFTAMAVERRPRALVIVAHALAAMKLPKIAKADLWWTRGVAETQVAAINGLLPQGWKSMMRYPMQLCGLLADTDQLERPI